MDFAAKLSAFDPSPELLAWMRKRVGRLVEEARTRATEIHWRDVKIEKLSLELAHSRRINRPPKNPSANALAVSPCLSTCRVSSTGTSPRCAPVVNVAKRCC
jgi:hypothetical protein